MTKVNLEQQKQERKKQHEFISSHLEVNGQRMILYTEKK